MPRGSNENVKPKTTVDEERLRMALSDIEGESLHTIINQDPDTYYFLASKDDAHPQSVERMKLLGYEVVNAETHRGEVMPRAVVKDACNGGAIQTPQLVLMGIPREIAEIRKRRFAEKAMELRQAEREELEEKVARLSESSSTGKSIFIMPGIDG